MNSRKTNPPKQAIWFLRHGCPGDNEALEGDLIERFREGQSRGWFWRQVLIASFVGVAVGVQRHWPHLCYAIAGTIMTWYFWNANTLRNLPGWLHWGDLPWPWSQLAFELSRPALVALTALPILAAGLATDGSFRWVSLLRTAVINLALIALGHYSIDFLPWLLRPVPGDSYHKFLIIPGVLQVILSFSTFFVAAYLGSVSPRRGNEEAKALATPSLDV